MKPQLEQTVFVVHPPIEFVYALNFIANEEALYKFYQEYNFSPSEEFRQLIEAMKSKLSRHLRSELLYFFEWRDMLSICGRILLENGNIRTVPDFIAFIDQLNEKELLSYVIRQVLSGESAFDDSLACWNDCGHISGSIKQLISDMDDKTEAEKKKLEECVENPYEFKSRLLFLITQFFEKCYKSVEEMLLEESSQAKERYEMLFRANPEYFHKEFLSKFMGYEYKKLVIHISYFTQIRPWIFLVKPQNNVLWISLGIYTEHYPRKVFITARVQKFVKILSDKKRFELIELLGKRPYYVYELAAELELTPPTVSYHLNSLLDLNLVSVERENSKAYYSLNKEIVHELLENAAEILLKREV